ncbi:MAG: alpha/beta hydrolase-fold protein [Myxococcota bacterium]
MSSLPRPPGSSGLALAAGLLLIACGHAHPQGRLEYVKVESRSEGRELGYGIYTPPGWDRTTPLPLVVLLHGAGDDETSADRTVVTDRLDKAITDGHVPAMVMVTPRGERGFWINWHDGSHHWQDWVLDEVVPQVRAKFPIIEGAAGMHLMGVSMGGGGGMQLWLDDPTRFSSATILSAPILDEEGTWEFLRRFVPRRGMERAFGSPGAGSGTDPYVALSSPEGLGGGRLLFGAASRDLGRILDSNVMFHEHLSTHAVPHRFVEFEGGHGWEAWSKVFPFALCHQLQPTCVMQTPEAWSVEQLPQ